jgi:hypothetical protein
VTETLLSVAYEISNGLSALPGWAVIAWLVFLFAAVTRTGIKAALGE